MDWGAGKDRKFTEPVTHARILRLGGKRVFMCVCVCVCVFVCVCVCVCVDTHAPDGTFPMKVSAANHNK
jgi:hypothetical protein